jgi:hypothetical protein
MKETGERRVVVWVVGRLRENTRRGYLPPRLACNGSGYEIRKTSKHHQHTDWVHTLPVESSQIVQTSAPYLERGQRHSTWRCFIRAHTVLSKVRRVRNERCEFNKYSTDLVLKFLGGVDEESSVSGVSVVEI